MKNITEIVAKQEEKEIINIAAYCRVSSDSEDQLHSFASQIRYYTEYVQTNPRYKLVDIYADEGITGTSMSKRDELNRLFRDCKNGKIDKIIVKSVSRFARNTEELIYSLRMLSNLGVSVYFEENGIDTSVMNSEMIVTFQGMIAQQESISISENMRWSYKKRMESGEFNCCYPAYGFIRENGALQIKEDEAKVIRKIYDLYLKGYGKQTISNILNKENTGNRKWNICAINYILNNERYMGDAVLQKKVTTESLPFKRVKNIGQQPKYYVENINEKIISKETYELAQKLQKDRQRYKTQNKKSYILSGILRCPDCGQTFRRQEISEKVYWICVNKSSGKSNCKSIRVKENEVYNSFNIMIMKLIDNRKNLLEPVIYELEKLEYTNESRQQIKEIDKEISNLSTQNLLLAKLYTKGILNKTDYISQSSEISNKLTKLRSDRKKKITSSESKILKEIETLNQLLKDIPITNEFNKDLFEEIVESITVKDNSTLIFKLIGGIEITEEIFEKGRCKVR